MQVRKQQLELDMEQQTGSKKDKEYIKAVYCLPVYLTYDASHDAEYIAGVQPPQDPGEPEGKTASAIDLERDKERIL